MTTIRQSGRTILNFVLALVLLSIMAFVFVSGCDGVRDAKSKAALKATQKAICLDNLKRMDNVKQLLPWEIRKSNTNLCTLQDLSKTGRFSEGQLACPGRGTYNPNTVGALSECSIHGHRQ
jgi:hypothetical protein